MLSRMGLVMLVGKGLLGTRTGRSLVGRLGRSAAKTVLSRLGKTATGAEPSDAGRAGGQGYGRRAGQGAGAGQGGRMGGRPRGCAGHAGRGGNDRQDVLRDMLLDVQPGQGGATCPTVYALPEEGAFTSSSGDADREAALSALEAHIVSFTNGRVRLRHPALRQPEAHALLREALGCQDCFTALTFSARTGSILLEYDGRSLSRADFGEAALPLGRFLAQWDQERRTRE